LETHSTSQKRSKRSRLPDVPDAQCVKGNPVSHQIGHFQDGRGVQEAKNITQVFLAVDAADRANSMSIEDVPYSFGYCFPLFIYRLPKKRKFYRLL